MISGIWRTHIQVTQEAGVTQLKTFIKEKTNNNTAGAKTGLTKKTRDKNTQRWNKRREGNEIRKVESDGEKGQGDVEPSNQGESNQGNEVMEVRQDKAQLGNRAT